MDRTIYKVCSEADWAAALRLGRYEGSADDRRDGYIHLSTGAQLAATLAKHFSGQPDLVLLAIAVADLGDRVKWEPARGGALFPHLYGPLEAGAAQTVTRLAIGPDGCHDLPKDLA